MLQQAENSEPTPSGAKSPGSSRSGGRELALRRIREIRRACGTGPILCAGPQGAVFAHALRAGSFGTQSIVTHPAGGASECSPAPLLPYADGSFESVVWAGGWKPLDDQQVARAIGELLRVTRRHACVLLDPGAEDEPACGRRRRDRCWWEYQFLRAGFRKHPLQFGVVRYEELENEPDGLSLVWEKIPAKAHALYPLEALAKERELHMDMSREPGRRSDAHLARYWLARSLLPETGTVLDAACGLGYGSALLAHGKPGLRVLGVDNSEFAIRYASENFSGSAEFVREDLAGLGWLADNSVDFVVSFETIEHLLHPGRFLEEVARVLKPGGGLIGSVPNQWTDESGRDPNPWHFHVFDLPAIASLLQSQFDLEGVWAQTAGGGMKLPAARRHLRPLLWPVTSGHDEAEWWIVGGRKPLLEATVDGRTEGRKVIVLCEQPDHPHYRSWAGSCPFPLEHFSPLIPQAQVPDDALLLVTHDTYREPSRTLIRDAVRRGIPTLILADGILEYRNTWEHPGLEPGAIFQPALGHKLAVLGASQARLVESWGNPGQCELVGAPRMDRYYGLRKRERAAGETFRVLIATALTPYFTESQRRKVMASLWDLQAWFGRERTLAGLRLEPVWRLTQGLEELLGVESQGGRDLAELLQQVDAVLTTPSTTLLEAMLLGLPTALLDYHHCPNYVPAAWKISAPSQIEEVLAELITPPEAKMLFQETMLHDALECATPARPRMARLIRAMVEHGLKARARGGPLEFPRQILSPAREPARVENRFRPERLHSSSQTAPAHCFTPAQTKGLDLAACRQPAERCTCRDDSGGNTRELEPALRSDPTPTPTPTRPGETPRDLPDDPELKYARALMAAQAGRRAFAEILLEEVLEAQPDHGGAHQTLRSIRAAAAAPEPQGAALSPAPLKILAGSPSK